MPPATIAAWQLFERLSTGALPAAVLAGYLTIYETARSQAAERPDALHPLLVHRLPAAGPAGARAGLAQAARTRTRFLLAWIAIFFAGAVVIFFAGSARYLLPMAAPVALLASRLRPRGWPSASPRRWR